MMWRKAVLFDDTDVADAVLAAPGPAEAKALGRGVRGFSSAVWTEHRFDVVVAGNRAKFTAHPDLGTYLVGTGDATIVEASPTDRIWGSGLAADHAGARDPSRWPGHNLLGRALMVVRAELAQG